MIIGRMEEQATLRHALVEENAQFIAVHGRRRVGKTFLIRETFNNAFAFQYTGAANMTARKQLARFRLALRQQGLHDVMPTISNWLNAFSELQRLITILPDGKKVIFLDELPWMDAPRSGFLSEFEAFWNGWASARKDIVLIACGSSTSWMVKKIIKNKGGLHNRLTHRISLKPFKLQECEAMMEANNIVMTREQVLQTYMIFGGVPYYWSLLLPGKSMAQEVDRLFFSEEGDLHDEFNMLYASLFHRPEPYLKVISLLAERKSGMTRRQIIEQGKFNNNGDFTTILNDLEWCGFIRSYSLPTKSVKEQIWQLIDNYTLFYYTFVNKYKKTDNFWETANGTSSYNTWCGLAFERVCLQHTAQIKKKLGISGIRTTEYAWHYKGDKNKGIHGAQIDLLIDRGDGIMDLCEMKFSQAEYTITEAYSKELANKRQVFLDVTKTRKAIHTIMVTTYGVSRNAYAHCIQNEITMDDLFQT